MRAIQKPAYGPNSAFEACVNDTADAGLRARLNAIAPEMLNAAVHYDDLANRGQLHDMPRSDLRDTDLQVGHVTKGELKNLYDGQMVPRSKAARDIYDNLRLAAPGGKCPTCGFGHVYTIDHFLPKSAFPWFSVSPENLVPSCRDCNTGKMACAASDAQSFHPYYDAGPLMQEQWLFAEVLRTTPISVRYFVRAPQHWNQLLALRAANHFRDYKIGSRFGTEAASELSALVYYFTSPRMQPDEIRDMLDRRLRAERQHQCNSWKIALFEALRDCVWFCSLQF